MEFHYNDGGRAAAGFKGNAGDCVARAVAIASGRSYLEVYNALSAGCRGQRLTKRARKRKASARNGVNTGRKWFRDYMRGMGFTWTPTMHIGTGCRVHLHEGELPAGRLVVSLSGHLTAVINGVIHDTHDPRREIHTLRPLADGESLKHGEWRIERGLAFNGRVLPAAASIQRRCVYGYWSAA